MYYGYWHLVFLRVVFYPSHKRICGKNTKILDQLTEYLYNFALNLLTKRMIYKIRLTLDVEEDVVRDIAIAGNATLEDLHNVITNAFGFSGTEMASFYLTNEDWEQGEEIPLFDMSDAGDATSMEKFLLDDVFGEDNDKLLYVYDFFSMWAFSVEVTDLIEDNDLIELPSLLFSTGIVPDKAPDKEFIAEDIDDEIEDYDNLENFDDFDFDNFDDVMN